MNAVDLSSRIHLCGPAPPSAKNPERSYIVYYITGNPGLIAYYRTFLTHLYGLLAPKLPSKTSLHVYGRSLSGFEVDVPHHDKDLNAARTPPYGLQEQIDHSEKELEKLVREVKARDGVQDVRVVLMGHSVGTYMLLEILRRIREKARTQSPDDSVRIVGGVCLFATVTHLAQSDSGKKATWLFKLPSFALGASLLVKALVLFVPFSFLSFLVQKVMSFPPDGAAVTTAFVKSRHGIYQALHMAGDELEQITSDSWDKEIWGAAHGSSHPHPRPILRFLFAKKDHWVADHTRDDLIKARGSMAENDVEEWKPKMEVDEEQGWPHSFCIKHSIPVAERVLTYLQDIIAKDS